MEYSKLNQDDYLYINGASLEIGESNVFQFIPKIKRVNNIDSLVLRLKLGYKVDHVISLRIILKSFNEYIIKNNTLSINLIYSIGNDLINTFNHSDNLCYVREPINKNKEIQSNINNIVVRKYLDQNYQYVLATVNKFKGHSIYWYLVNNIFQYYYPSIKFSQVYQDLNK